MGDRLVGDFREWLEEEGVTVASSATSTTGSVDSYDKPWNRSVSEYGIRRMLGIKNSDDLRDDEFIEDEELKKIADRVKSQFFGTSYL